MENKDYITYVELFSKLYSEGQIEIKWLNHSAQFRATEEVEEEIQKSVNISHEEFIKVAFEIVRISQALATGINPKNYDRDKIKIISEIFLTPERLEFINVHCYSKNNVLEGFDYDILTKRSQEKPTEVLAYTALLNFISADVYGEKENDNYNKLTLELSKKEMLKLIENLKGIYSNMESLEKKEAKI
ncbi:hypothetical protein ACMX9J_14350 [Priestia sp. RMT2NF4]|uniref:hypothetical protein n=1 Tax=Priestia sp. RMT2NF4 TaxID=3398394 RepID=UPI003A4C66BC